MFIIRFVESQMYIKKRHSSPGLLKSRIEAVHFWGYINQLHVITLKKEIYSINNIKLPSHSSYENTRKEENYFYQPRINYIHLIFQWSAMTFPRETFPWIITYEQKTLMILLYSPQCFSIFIIPNKTVG